MIDRKIDDCSYFRDLRIVCGTKDELNNWFVEKENKTGGKWGRMTPGVSGKFCWDNLTGTKYILIDVPQHGITWTSAMLGHEVLHYVFHVMRDVPVILCEESEEAFTYYFQYIFSECLKTVTEEWEKKQSGRKQSRNAVADARRAGRKPGPAKAGKRKRTRPV